MLSRIAAIEPSTPTPVIVPADIPDVWVTDRIDLQDLARHQKEQFHDAYVEASQETDESPYIVQAVSENKCRSGVATRYEALKKCFKYFAGVILSEISEEGTLKVNLMKCVKGKIQQIAFIYPKVDDIDVVDLGDVVTLLPETGPCGGTPRAAKRLYFPEVDLSMYF
ncbi:hypothetical protein CAPTEDRAFT_216657 [Capitella teleta]|uniref:Uncharacterized protein n=1 Tax=Capitella teleta TaxID=283909 RepID=R7UD44_CAPTE|nr:hypothetical protein CAPTEDRAFT_216657 [Capitella teleta]|eukprot:ELU01187.1 hypothetical protein CAPTEDRAFT_216657 [Capitella teleta]